MTNLEFSNEFDILYNNIMSNQAPGLDEYEKSVFLTKAQNEIIKNYFNPKGNKYQEGFDDSPKRQIDFSTLVKTLHQDSSDFEYLNTGGTFHGKARNTKIAEFPKDAMMVLNEFIDITRDKSLNIRLLVVPISYEEYNIKNSKPYRFPLKNQAWRIFAASPATVVHNDNKAVELIPGPNDEIKGYDIRYVAKPSPIILENLPEGLSIDGKSEALKCTLDTILHPEILQRAVELAKAAYTGDLNSSIELGKRSE